MQKTLPLLLIILLSINSISCAQWLVLNKSFFLGFPESELDDWKLNGDKSDIISQCGPYRIVGGFGKFSQSTTLYRIFDNLPTHTKVRVSFRMYQIDMWEEFERSEVKIDNEIKFTRYKPVNAILNNICGNNGAGITNNDAQHPVTFTVNHSSSSLKVDFTENLDENATNESWGISHVFIEYFGECENGIVSNGYCIPPPDKSTQECHDNLGELMDGEGNTLMTNQCDPFIDNEGKQAFKFTTMFLEPYKFDDECLDIQVCYENSILNQGNDELNEWTFDPVTQKIIWNIRLEDFVSVYSCEWITEDDQYTWICDFSVKILFMGMEQQNYMAKIKVTVDRIQEGKLELDVQKNEVVGVCCENELNIQTALNFCTDFECTSFLPDPLTVIRKDDFFIVHRIVNPQFQNFYLKLVQVQLGEFFPVIVNKVEEKGRVRLQLRSNIAKPNLILSVISQLHKTAPSRRFLREKSNVRDDYRLISYEQLSIINPKDDLSSEKLSEQQQQNSDEQNTQVVQESGFLNDQNLSYIIIGSGVLIGFIIIGLVCCVLRKKNSSLEREKEYQVTEVPHHDQSIQQNV